MPQSYYIDGALTYRPTVSVTTEFNDRSGLTPATKTLAVVGSFPFLEPFVPYMFTSQGTFLAAAPNNTLLKDLANIIYSPSTRAPFNSSPGAVVLVNAQSSTQATAYAKTSGAVDTVKFTSAIWGTSGNLASVQVAPRLILGGYDVIVASNGVTDEFVIDEEVDTLTLAYAHPDNGDTMVAPKTAKGFDDTIAGDGSVTATKASGAENVTVTFTRTLDTTCVSATDAHTSWIPDGPLAGILAVTVPGGDDLTVGPNLRVKFTGYSSVGVAATEIVTFSKAEVEGMVAVSKNTTTNWASVTKVSIYSDAGAADWADGGSGGELTISGTNFILGSDYGQEKVANAVTYVSNLKGFAANTSSYVPNSIPVAELDPIAPDLFPATLSANRWGFITNFNLNTSLVVAETEGNYLAPPDFSSEVTLSLTAGTQTVADSSSWTSAFTALQVVPATTLVPYTTESSIQVLAQAHVDYMWGKGQRECQLVVVPPALSTPATIKSLRRQFNFKTTVLCDAVRVTQWDGTTSGYNAEYWALMFGALQCACPVIGQPLGGAQPRVVAFTRHASLMGNDGADEMLRNSVTPLDDLGRGIHVVRWVTAHADNNDLTRTEGSAVESIAFSNLGVREVVRPFLNQRAIGGLRAVIESEIAAELGAQATGNRIRTWTTKSLVVTETPATFIAKYDFAPILPVNNIAVTSNAFTFPRA